MPRSIPNYLTIDPTTGAVGAFFSGGVQMQEGSLNNGTFDPENGIGFRRAHNTIAPGTSQFGGLLYEYEGGAGNPAFEDRLIMQAQSDGGRSSEIIEQATSDPFGDSGTVYMRLAQRYRDATLTGAYVSASPFGGGGAADHEYTILDAQYRSHFLRWVNSKNIQFGNFLLFPSGLLGSGGSVAAAAQAHGLPAGFTGGGAIVENADAGNGYWINYTRIAFTATTIQYAFYNFGPGNAAINLVVIPYGTY